MTQYKKEDRTLLEFAFIAAKMTHSKLMLKQVRCGELGGSKMRELKKKQILLRPIIMKNKDQTKGHESGRTIRILLTELNEIMDRIIKSTDDHLTNGQINSPTEMMEIDRMKEITRTKMKFSETMEFFPVAHQGKGGTFHSVTNSGEFSLSHLKIHHLEDETVTQPLVLHHTNRTFREALINPQRTWFASPQLMNASTSYRNFAR